MSSIPHARKAITPEAIPKARLPIINPPQAPKSKPLQDAIEAPKPNAAAIPPNAIDSVPKYSCLEDHSFVVVEYQLRTLK